MLFVIIAMANVPILIYDDKYNYQEKFINTTVAIFVEGKDYGWSLYTFIIKVLLDDADSYFLITAFLYTIGYYIFAKKFIPQGTIFIFLLATFSSFGFLSYGINTIRSGFALSLFLIALTYNKRIFLFTLIATLSILSHKSLALPVFAFILTKYYNSPKTYFVVWIGAFFISLLNIGFITTFFEENLGSFDERSNAYFISDAEKIYNTGFRLDFIEYSLLPIVVGFFYIIKLKVNDIFYLRLFNTYLIVNAFWILMIRMAFTDRIAYLSWFLIPFILLYPLLKYKLEINAKKTIFAILTVVLAFTSFMVLK